MLLLIKIILSLITSYLLGAIPFGYIVMRWGKGIDIRLHGSGNIGATNVVRVAGLAWGAPVFVLDFLKGAVPVFVSTTIVGSDLLSMPLLLQVVTILNVVAAVSGHNWSVYLGFRGGKGVATSVGALVGLSVMFSFLRIPILLTIITWLVVFFRFRLVSLASMTAALVFMSACVLATTVPVTFKALSVLLSFFIIIRHRKNFKEILQRFSA